MLKSKLSQYIKLSSNPQIDQSIEPYLDDVNINQSFQKYTNNVETEVRELRNIVKTLESDISKAKDFSENSNENDSSNDLSSKIQVLENNLKQIPSQLSSFSCLGQILAINQLETTNKQISNTIELLKSQQDLLNKQFERENQLNNELKSLGSLLKKRLQQTTDRQPSSSAMNSEDIIDRLREKYRHADTRNKTRTSQLQQLLENVAAPIIVAGNEHLSGQPSLDLQDVQQQLNFLILQLLNNMSSTEPSEGYVEIPESYGSLVKFLLNGDLITMKPDDPRYIRLREFGM